MSTVYAQDISLKENEWGLFWPPYVESTELSYMSNRTVSRAVNFLYIIITLLIYLSHNTSDNHTRRIPKY